MTRIKMVKTEEEVRAIFAKDYGCGFFGRDGAWYLGAPPNFEALVSCAEVALFADRESVTFKIAGSAPNGQSYESLGVTYSFTLNPKAQTILLDEGPDYKGNPQVSKGTYFWYKEALDVAVSTGCKPNQVKKRVCLYADLTEGDERAFIGSWGCEGNELIDFDAEGTDVKALEASVAGITGLARRRQSRGVAPDSGTRQWVLAPI